ncbi:MAG: hypothetical protein KA195_00185 [Burkholderiaceae bacterium]|nr:hypothetical protein [Burkholderiaceae bacterium]
MQVQMPAARRLAQLPDQYADGGLVARMKSADAGPAAFGARGLSQLRDMIPKIEAMGYKQQPQSFADGGMVHSLKGMLGLRPKTREELLAADAKAQARNQEAAGRVAERSAQQPAPATPAPQAAITDYSGMNAMQRREKEQGLADGGMVAPRRMDIGQWAQGMDQWRGEQAIADARQAKAFQDQADADEYARQQAEASKLRDQQQAGAAQPQLGFANGGMIRGPGTGTSDSIPDEMAPGTYILPADTTKKLALDDKKVPVRVSNGEYELPPEQVQAVGAAVLDAIKGVTHAPKSLSARGLQSPQDEQFFATGGSVRDPEELRKMIPQVEAMGYAQSPAAAPATAPAPAQPSEYGRQMREVGGALADGASWLGKTIVSAPGYGFNSRGAPAAPATPSTIASPPTSQTNPAAAPASTSLANAGRGVVNPPTINPSAPAPSNAPSEVMPGVYRHGRGQYSDNASGMGMPANFTGQPNAQNMAAGESLAARSQQASMGRALSAPAGFQPQGVTAPTVRNSTNDWAARKALENMATAASSITNRPEWQSGSTTIAGSTRGPKGEGDPEGKVAAYKAALANDIALQQAQSGLDQTAMRENAGITREGMQQDGATTRTNMQEQGSNTREAGRNALTAEELALRREAQWFQTRAAQQQEQLRNVLLNPKATPEQRAMAQRSLAALSGKTATDRMQTVTLPDTTTETGQVVRGGQALVRVLEDGTVQQVPIGAQGRAQLPPGMTKQVGTSNGRPVYEDAKGNRFVG